MKYPQYSNGMDRHHVKFPIDKEVKPIYLIPKIFLLRLHEKAQNAVEDVIRQDISEEHPKNEH